MSRNSEWSAYVSNSRFAPQATLYWQSRRIEKYKVRSQKAVANIRAKIESQPKGIFGVPLRQSITYANVAISLVDEDGQSYIYGYVPIVVAKCGVFLKEKG